ncbi:hypothetical protein [Glaciimonas immobilis]|uniref:Uncharacterized protein n=1 Tax=Glaciimonas immobilis TaxID=728004 RepID=A0A840RLF2_9BURK|nr:hypothetical protein [Glaciimonas immobilis]KAF3999047.1 hypothetical protein HAV38_03630 [Glaciimonas immobilis]MBB5198475.1 hypothetical protein [Glaciimonas immobilis]
MYSSQQAPFSARNKGAHRQIDAEFPPSAQIGLLHLLLDLIDRDFIDGWISLARELQRIARLPPIEYNNSGPNSSQRAKKDAEQALAGLSWDKAYDFCERLHNYMAREVGIHYNNDFQVTMQKTEVQAFIASELQRLFFEEELAFEFTEGLVRRRGRKHTVDIATRAQVVLGDVRLASARKHYDKALQFFRSPSSPDYENCVKEAVCAVEAAGKALFPAARAATLGDLAKWFASAKDIAMPKALVQTITGIYAYRSGGDGVGHGGAAGGAATREVAEYVLAVCASQIIYMVDLSNSHENDVPF